MAQRRNLWNGLKLILLHVSSSKVSQHIISIIILKEYLDRDPEYCTYIDRYFGNKSVILEAEMELLKHVKGYFRDFPSSLDNLGSSYSENVSSKSYYNLPFRRGRATLWP